MVATFLVQSRYLSRKTAKMAENVTLEDLYTLLADTNRLVAENNAILKQVQAMAEQLPQLMEQVTANPMFKPFAKMLGL
jgi:hypothetical protein